MCVFNDSAGAQAALWSPVGAVALKFAVKSGASSQARILWLDFCQEVIRIGLSDTIRPMPHCEMLLWFSLVTLVTL
jgi:hypothetical protein